MAKQEKVGSEGSEIAQTLLHFIGRIDMDMLSRLARVIGIVVRQYTRLMLSGILLE